MIHPLSDVQSNRIGEDTFVWQFSIVLKGAVIGKRCNINCSVLIENNVWIGSNVSLAPGAYIGEGSIIGMNSVVFGEIPKNSIALGNPAQVVKKRDLNHYKFLKDNSYFLNDIRGLNYFSKS